MGVVVWGLWYGGWYGGDMEGGMVVVCRVVFPI